MKGNGRVVHVPAFCHFRSFLSVFSESLFAFTPIYKFLFSFGQIAKWSPLPWIHAEISIFFFKIIIQFLSKLPEKGNGALYKSKQTSYGRTPPTILVKPPSFKFHLDRVDRVIKWSSTFYFQRKASSKVLRDFTPTKNMPSKTISGSFFDWIKVNTQLFQSFNADTVEPERFT